MFLAFWIHSDDSSGVCVGEVLMVVDFEDSLVIVIHCE